ncbi:MAG: toast rack family protein [Anaerolineales bacterium]|jgi:hypothetical protein
MTPSRLRWGLILIQIGLLILLVNIGVLNWNFTIDLLSAIPFFLIAVGVEKIFTRSRLQFISYLAVLFIFFGGLYVAYEGSYGSERTSYFKESTYQLNANPEVKTIKAVLKLGEGDLTIRDATDDLVYARFADFTPKPSIRYELEDSNATVTFTSGSDRLLGGVIRVELDEASDWTVYFSKFVPLDLECRGEKSDINLNLATTPLRNLKVDADNADMYVRLANVQPVVTADFKGTGSDLLLRLPINSGVRFEGRDFDSYLRQIGLIETDGAFVNEGYDTLVNKIDINLDSRLDNLTVEFF